MDQFNEYTYPIPKEEDGSEIHMMWTDTPCRITCWNGGNETELAMRNPEDRIYRCPASLAGKRLSFMQTLSCPSIPTWKWTILSPTFDRELRSPT
jgi:hypothetical protein